MGNSANSGNILGYAPGTQPGLVSTVAQTFAGKKTLDGGALIKGDTSGSAIASSYVGEMLGTLRSGTGGFTYSTQSTTAPTQTTYTAVLQYTLNKGVYLISYRVRCYITSGTSELRTQPRIGGTTLTAQPMATQVTASYFGSNSETLPIVISSDSTVFDIYASIGAGGPALGNAHEMWIVRID